VELARRFNGEIINADAMQMYRGLPVITNKLSDVEQRGVPHKLLGSIGLDEEPWEVSKFREQASALVQEIRSRGKLPIVVGGSHYYIESLLFENTLLDSDEDGFDSHLEEKYPILQESTDRILLKLKEVDPVMANRWHPNDRRKIMRSLAIFLQSGRRASDIYAEQKSAKQVSEAGWQSRALLFWVYTQREVLVERLNKRVDMMLDKGLLQETEEMHAFLTKEATNGHTIDCSKGIWQSIGFKQVEPYLIGMRQGQSAEALEKLKREVLENIRTANRRYAKAQQQWITHKTLPKLQEAGALDHVFVLDSTERARWSDEVVEKAANILQLFLSDDELPSPPTLSQTAADVLSQSLARSTRLKRTPCRKYCDVCNATFLTEEQWRAHIGGHSHRRTLKRVRQAAAAVTAPSRSKECDEAMPGNLDSGGIGEPPRTAPS